MPAELAVIVPVRDGAATLAATVDATVALFRAAAVEIDLLIVDDGSKDETPKVIASLVERHREVRAMCSAAPGLSAARNTGLRSTSAPILGLIDADDVWLPPIASSALTLLRATDVPIVQGRARDLWCDSGREGLTYDMVGVGSMLFRRSTFDVVGGWDESLCIHEDYDWLLRAYDARVEKLRFDEAVLEYRRHSRGITAGGPTDPRTRIVVQRTALRRRRRGLPPLPAGFPSLASYLGVPPPAVHQDPGRTLRRGVPAPTAGRSAPKCRPVSDAPKARGLDDGSLVPINERPIPGEGVLAVSCVRNELDRLPAMLAHHRRLGVRAFLVIDNGSSDGTAEYLAQQDDVHVFHAPGSFAASHCGTAWMLSILERFGHDRWCLVVDADELFWFAGMESSGIDELCEEMDSEGAEAILSVMMDVYPSGPLQAAPYEAGTDPLAVYRWFDRQPWTSARDEFCGHDGHRSFFGGARQRVFGGLGADGVEPTGAAIIREDDVEYTLNKVPLFRFREDLRIAESFHWMEGARMASGRAALLHWKYTDAFAAHAEQETARGEHWNGAAQYARYAAASLYADVVMFDESLSVALIDSAQLVELGILEPMEAMT